MIDEDKSRGQLIQELVYMRQQLQALGVEPQEPVAYQGQLASGNQPEAQTGEMQAEGYWKFVAMLPQIVCRLDMQGKVIHANEHAFQVTGYTQEDIEQGLDVLQLLQPEDRMRASQNIAEVLRGGTIEGHEYTMLCKDGSNYPVLVYATPISQGGRPVGLSVIAVDITDQKHTEEALRRSEERYRLLTEQSPLPISIIGEDGTYQYVNSQFTRTFGYTLDDISTGSAWFQHAYPDEAYREEARSAWRSDVNVSQHSGVLPRSFRVTCKNGTQKDILFRPVTVSTSETFVLYEDITERRQAEEALQTAHDTMQRHLDIAGVMFVGLNTDGNITLLNRKGYEILGYSEGELVGKNWFDTCIPEAQRETVAQVFQQLMSGSLEPVEYYENPILARDGEERIIAWHNSILKDETGAIVGFLSSGEDVTDRRLAEEAVRGSERRYRELFNNANDIIYTHDLKGNFVSINPRVEEVLGYTSEEVLRMSLVDVVAPESLPLAQEMTRRKLQGDEDSTTYPLGIITKDGQPVALEVSSRLIYENGKPIAVEGIARDITKRMQAEQALHESEARYRNIIALSRGVAYQIDWNTDTFVFVDEGIETLTGYPREEITPFFFQSLVTERSIHAPDAHRQDELSQQIGGKMAERYRADYQLRTRDGKTVWVTDSALHFRNEDGSLMGALGMLQDITEQIQAREREQELQRRAEEQEKHAAVGQLAAGIAHDFNNILTGILGYTELGVRHLNEPETIQQAFQVIQQQGERAARLVKQILDFSRKSVIREHPVALVPFLTENIKLLQRTIPENIKISFVYGADDYIVNGDVTQLQQVVTNLAVNARDAMPAGGTFRIRLDQQSFSPTDHVPFPGMEAKTWHVLSVSDTGTGIPQEIQDRIYEPFFTTKEVGQGTGLGLSQVYGIVKQHGGFIDVASDVDEGSTFLIYLPPSMSPTETAHDMPSFSVPPGGGQTILVVEDEATVSDVVERMLRSLGYNVLTARDGEQALAVYQQASDLIRVVLSDVVMPNLSGTELIQMLRASGAEAKFVLMSGYPLDDMAEELHINGVVGWVQKPISLSKLTELLHEAMGE